MDEMHRIEAKKQLSQAKELQPIRALCTPHEKFLGHLAVAAVLALFDIADAIREAKS